MTHRLGISVAALLCMSGALAYAEDETPGANSSPESAALSEKLDEFLDDAIEGGLLQPRTEPEPSLNVPDPAPYRAPKRIVKKRVVEEPVVEEAPPAPTPTEEAPVLAAQPSPCEAPYALDFSEFKAVRKYTDLSAYPDLESEGDGIVDHARLKAMLALGLYTEARVLAKTINNDEAQSIFQLATMLEHGGTYDGDHFRVLADCFEEAQLWRGVEMLVDREDGGAELVSSRLTEFRYLPYHLKIDVATIAVPALLGQGQRAMADKLMASFSETDLQQSPRLEFVGALMEMDHGTPVAPAVQAFMENPDYQLAATAALIKTGHTLTAEQQESLNEQVIRSLQSAESDREVAVRLRYAVNELGAASNYQLITRLAELPKLQKPYIREELVRHVATAARADMASEDKLRKLAVIDLLVNSPETLGRTGAAAELYKNAQAYAQQIGYHQLATRLDHVSTAKTNPVYLQAEAAYKHGDDETALSLALTASDDRDVSLIGALSSIRTGAQDAYQGFENNLPTSASSLTRLLEAEALSGHWFVSGRLHALAGEVTDEPYATRIARVKRLKEISTRQLNERQNVPMQDVGKLLAQSEGKLNTLGRGAN